MTPKRRLTRRSRHGVIGMLAVTLKSSETSNATPNLYDLIKDEDDWTCRFLFCLKQQFRRVLAASTPLGEKECIYVPRVRSFLNEQGQRVPRAFEVMSRRNVGKGVQVKTRVLHHCQVWSLVQL